MPWEVALGYVRTDPPSAKEASLARFNAELASGGWEPLAPLIDTFGIIILLRRRTE